MQMIRKIKKIYADSRQSVLNLYFVKRHHLQGDTSGCFPGFVDIKTKVALLNEESIPKLNFWFAVKKPDVSPCSRQICNTFCALDQSRNPSKNTSLASRVRRFRTTKEFVSENLGRLMSFTVSPSCLNHL